MITAGVAAEVRTERPELARTNGLDGSEHRFKLGVGLAGFTARPWSLLLSLGPPTPSSGDDWLEGVDDGGWEGTVLEQRFPGGHFS